jgi:hypothetical protein
MIVFVCFGQTALKDAYDGNQKEIAARILEKTIFIGIYGDR